MGDALQQLVHLQCFNPQRAVEAIPARAEELRKYIKMNRFNPQRAVEAIPACRFGRVGFCVALQWHFASEAFSPEFSPYQQKLRAIHAPM